MNTSAFLADLVVFPEVSGVAGFTDVKRFTFETAMDSAHLADIITVGEVIFNTVAFIVLKFSVDSGLTCLAVLGVAALNAVLDSVTTFFASSILIEVLISVDALTHSIL